MKKITFFIGVLLIVSLSAHSGDAIKDNGNAGVVENLYISSSTGLENLTNVWVEEFNQVSDKDIQLVNQSGATSGTIRITYDREQVSKSNWSMLIGRLAVVPVINKANPFIDKLYKSGISSDNFSSLLSESADQNWNSLLKDVGNIPVKIYIQENDQVINAVRQFTGISTMKVIVLPTDELLKAVKEDVFSIAFCYLHDVMQPSISSFIEYISIVPVDKNSNGRLDKFENIYSNSEVLIHGIWLGKYPKNLSESIYAIADEQPSGQTETSFLNWIVSDGKKYLEEKGYISLTSSQEQASIDKLIPPVSIVNVTKETTSSYKWFMILAVIIVTGLAGILLFTILKMFIKGKSSKKESLHIASSFNEDQIIAPSGLYYAKSHTWSYLEKDGTVKIGVDDFLQHITGQLTSIKMRESGEAIRKGEKMLTIIKDGKHLDLYAPVSGIIKEQNHLLVNDTKIINENPYTDGWVYTIIPKNWTREIEFMLFGDNYRGWLADEFNRLKDFLAGSVKTNNMAYQHIILQDGGEITDNVLSELEPKVWEDFQSKFLDCNK